MTVVFRKAIRAYVPETFVIQDSARAQGNALAKLLKRAIPPGRTRLAHTRSMTGVDSGNLRGCVVVIRMELVWVAVRVFHDKLTERAAIGWRGNICPSVFIEEDDLYSHLSA